MTRAYRAALQVYYSRAVQDVKLLQKAVLGEIELTPEQSKAADMNDDSIIDVIDLCLLRRQLLKTQAFPKVSQIAVKIQPNKNVYTHGDTIDTIGLSLNVIYSDGSTEVISNGFTCSDLPNTLGTHAITATYAVKP